jgi:Gpi18-like mannosyltransferase
MNPWTFAESVSLIPVAACAFAFVGLYRRWPPFRPALPLLLFFALAIRWYFLVQFPNPSGDVAFDAESYKIVGSLVRAGKDVYANTDRHPYLPFQMYFMAAASWLGDNTGPHFFSWVRWPNIMADLGITVLIYRSLLRLGRGESEAFWFAFIWAVHPVSIYTSVIHGQFDSVAVFFSLLSWHLARFWRGWTGAALGGAALGIAILDKTWPVILLPALVVAAPELRRRLVFSATALVVPLVAIGIYQGIFGTTMHLIELKVVNYGAVPDRYGFTYAFAHYLQGVVPDHWLPYFREHGRDIFLVSVVIVASVVVPRRDTLTSCVALLATFLVFANGWGSQYLVWIVPFAIMARQRVALAAYSAVATAALLVYYWGTCGYQCPGRLSNTWQYWEFQWIWPLAMIWLAREILAALWAGPAPDAPIVVAARSLIRGLRRGTGAASAEP